MLNPRFPMKPRWSVPLKEGPFPLDGAVRAIFEVKTEQDKVENDFKNGGSNFMLVREGGKGGPENFFPYTPPTGAWERRYVELATADGGLSDVEAIRVGVNPLGMRLTFWLRNLAVLRASSANRHASATRASCSESAP